MARGRGRAVRANVGELRMQYRDSLPHWGNGDTWGVVCSKVQGGGETSPGAMTRDIMRRPVYTQGSGL